MTMEEQKRIDDGRMQMAQEIVDGQAASRPEMTVDDWKAFARNWIATAAQHASNETYFREQRDSAVHALAQVAKLPPEDPTPAVGIAADALKDLHYEGEYMKILPTMSKGVVFVHEDGKTFEMAPLQVFIGGSGQTVIRIGRNALFFDKDGRFDGTESHVAGFGPDSEEARVIREAFEAQGEYKGLPPEEPYFQEGTPGHAAEVRAWASARREDGGKLYTAVHKTGPGTPEGQSN